VCGRWGEGTLCLGLKPLFFSLPLSRMNDDDEVSPNSLPFHQSYGFYATSLALEMWRPIALHLILTSVSLGMRADTRYFSHVSLSKCYIPRGLSFRLSSSFYRIGIRSHPIPSPRLPSSTPLQSSQTAPLLILISSPDTNPSYLDDHDHARERPTLRSGTSSCTSTFSPLTAT
jgi:hypothetical protein